MEALEALRTRRSVRVYQDRAVPRELIEQVVDCGRMAPSGMNTQQWLFVAVTQRPRLDRLAELIPHCRFLSGIPAVVAVLVQPEGKYFLEDGAAATMAMLVAARAVGLGSCWVSGDKQPYAEVVRSVLGASGSYKLVSLVALGYAAEEPEPSKKPLESVLRWDQA